MMNKNRDNKKIVKALFVCLIAGLFLMPVSASSVNDSTKTNRQSMMNGGDTIYVDDDNTGGPWDGTIYYPYQFIQEGIDHACNDDTVYVFNGVYVENVVICVDIDLIGEDNQNTIIDGGTFGTVINIYAEGVTVTGFTITNSGVNSNNAGILLHTSYNIITVNNIVENNYYGIRVLSGDNTIYHNNIIDNTYQAFDEVASSAWDAGYPTGGNYWSDYQGVDENEDGIGEIPYPTGNSSTDRYPLVHPYGSVYNQDTGEIFLTIQGAINDPETLDNHTIRVKNGLYLEHVSVDKSLVISGEDAQETIIDGRGTTTVVSLCADESTLQGFMIKNSGAEEQYAGVQVTGDLCTITNTVICENYQGIIVKHSSEDVVISYNIIRDNNWNGIILKGGCEGTVIFENYIHDNFYAGIGITDASANFIYHNSFVANRYHAYDQGTNVWDDGYPSGGNYWDDYTGVDVYSGPNQDESPSDGIGDTPYAIPDGVNTDRYPLMAPYSNQDTISPTVTITSPENGLYLRDHRFFSRLFKQRTILIGDITVNAVASDAQSGVQKVEFYLNDVLNPESVDTTAPYSWTWTNRSLLKHRYTIIVVAYDNAGNYNVDMIEVKKFF